MNLKPRRYQQQQHKQQLQALTFLLAIKYAIYHWVV